MHFNKQYDDKQWKAQIQLANSMFSEGGIEPSIEHYQEAINIAKQLFIEFQETEPVPDALTPVVVISYINLAECWSVLNKKKEQILCLIEVYDYLKTILKDSSISYVFLHQVYEGLSKVYLELCICFKEIDAHEILYETEEDFSELTLLYQSQSNSIH